MIHYELRCGQAHEFDGWFPGSTAFEAQAARGLLECPVCGDRAIVRALMAPAVPRKGRALALRDSAAEAVASPADRAAPEPDRFPPGTPRGEPPAEPDVRVPTAGMPSQAVSGEQMPARLRAMLQRLRAEVERNCDNVGADFADEARRMHRGESDRRAIYGDATPEDVETLADEGIEVSRIPWVPRADG